MTSKTFDIKEISFKRLINILCGKPNDSDIRILLHISLNYGMELTKRYVRSSRLYIDYKYDIQDCALFYYLIYIDELQNIDNYLPTEKNDIGELSYDRVIYNLINKRERDPYSISIFVKIYEHIRNPNFIILLYRCFPRILISILQITHSNNYFEYTEICSFIYSYDKTLSHLS